MQTPPTKASALRTALQLVLALVLVGLAACGGGLLGGGAPVPDRPASGTVTGEIERIETYADEIDIWTQDRRIVTVRYDDDTPVWYQGERYQVTNLEAGDVVTVAVDRAADGDWIARRIDVDRGVQDRTGDDPYDDDPYEDDPYDPDDEVATLTGEVERVDTGNREIEIDTSRGREVISYRTDTVVYFQGERYQVENLEPGDVIRTHVERDYRGGWITDSITVERSRQERGIGDDPSHDDDPFDDGYDDDLPADAVRYAGTVQEVDARRGEFVLRTERYGLKTIVMPYDASRADRDAFDRLRRGDRVEIEAAPLERDRAELLRFGWR